MKWMKFGPIILALVIYSVIMMLPSSFLEKFVGDKKLKEAADSLSPVTFQGVVLQDKMLKHPKYLPIYGSSELSRMDQFHPSNYFSSNRAGFTPFLIGRGGTQSLVHFLDFASVQNSLKNRKLVFILSPQWFTPKGLDDIHFSPNFSTLQTYKFVLNKQIDPVLKKQAAERLLQFEVVKKDAMLSTLLRSVVSNDPTVKLKASVEKPLAEMYVKILERKDLLNSISDIEAKTFERTKRLPPNLSWQRLRQRAEQVGERNTLSNPFNISDLYYKKHIAHKLDKLRNYKAGQSYENSVEYDDLRLILELFKKEHVDALFISVPVNGYWYDYAGFPKEGRAKYYAKIRQEITSAGFKFADYSNHEYDKYFLEDTMHLGWKGWTYVDQDLEKFYKNKKPSVNHPAKLARSL